jgi:hypothetical protein
MWITISWLVDETNANVNAVILPKPKNVINPDDMAENDNDNDDNSSSRQPAPKMAYKLLARDNRGRVETRQFLVPQSAQMCVNLAKAEAEMKLEKQIIKQKTLQIESMNERVG